MAGITKLTSLTVCLFLFVSCAESDDLSQSDMVTSSELPTISDTQALEWNHYGGSLGGDRFAHNVQISPENVNSLELAWVFQTGDATNGSDDYFGRRTSFKATPLYFQNKLVFSTGFNRVIALDPETGEQLWTYDPKVDFSIKYSEMFTSRGVAAWSLPEGDGNKECQHRIYLGTLDARLIALDAETGLACSSFGEFGEVDLSHGIKYYRRGEYSLTSPPTVVNGVVVVGSSIGDNGAVALDEGKVRAFDAITGELRWHFNPVPKNDKAPGREDWQAHQARRTGAGNVWSVISADPVRDLVFLPTTSPSPDFYGGERTGDNRYANSIVALRASTGEFVWGYQVVRHDLWDYDVASQPLLIDLEINGISRPALAQATKMGFVFVLDRETGEPLHEVLETLVPLSDIKGEEAAQTQKFPKIRLHSTSKDDFKLWARNDKHIAECRSMLKGIRYEGIFTPPSLQGSLLYPGNPGGTNWGSMAADPATGVALVAVNRWPTVVKLLTRKEFNAQKKSGHFNGIAAQYTAQSGSPYGMARYDVYSRETGLPCHEGPWSTLAAVDLATGETIWEAAVGRALGLDDDNPAVNWGYFVRGGPMITSGGVGFLATPHDFTLRAHNLETGKTLWEAELPAKPGATPMAYIHKNASYVVATAGGQVKNDVTQGDYVVAYRVAH